MPAQSKGSGKKSSSSLSISEQEYKKVAKKHEPARPIWANCIKAFLVGGLICVIGQAIQEAFMAGFDMTSKEAASPTVAVMILISVILTCLGVYDKMAQWAGAGTAVPVTGFANSMCSAALEHRAEGLVLGVGANMFKLAGSVIVFGVVAAFIVGIVYAILGFGGGHL
ncbi:MAG TPA: stage V sporulation protein AC [Paenibacillus sp.]|uniref:stage V sporulation protein AC n=1 Tax=Paenibacillus TaxID=44249 RepID=UPI000BA18379|nr:MULTISPECIES: stage V sporulation protein AC [Paenibacillus]OZQ68336.1 stage V sporulation protein AC [Paenibacillus taichungensis]HBU85233.1 stage V sporulation protein AC [Paenibacillus sp.]